MISRNLWGEYDGKRFFSAAELGMIDIVLPPDNPEKTNAREGGEVVLGENFMGGDIRIGEMYLKSLVFTPLADNGIQFPFTAGTISLGVDASDARQHITANMAEVTLGREALASRMATIPYGAQLRSIIPSLPETLTADASVDMDVTSLPDGRFALSFKPFTFALKDLVSFSLSMDMRGVSFDDDDSSVGLVDMTVTDNGLSDILFAFVGEQQGKTGVNLRQETRMQLSAAMFSLQGTLAELCANALDFLEKPGATLNVKVQPPEMLAPEMLGLMIMSDPDGVGISSTLTRDDKQ